MKISYLILHNYQTDLLRVIGSSLHLTLQDDLYNQLDLSTAVDFVTIKLNKRLKFGEFLCCFEVEIDDSIYNITKYEDFIKGFTNRLQQERGFFKLLKFIDELRLEIYKDIYSEIADIEMKLREVFSYIFYSKYDDKNQDIFEEFDVSILNKEDIKNDVLISRLENKFFYLTFKQYLRFDSPKDIPAKDVLPLIANNDSYDLLRAYVNSRGIIEQKHAVFLKNVNKLLDPIENVRNCIAHNREIPNNQLQNYPNAKNDIIEFINKFWEDELDEQGN